ncbi:YciI family protein [Rhizobium sp. SGZ-381]|uniref:YciI family protein n=1 Tax=Rhizobium sp. SGZ-381 TaxID=3342800 RepID=UPI00366EBD56
MLYAIKLTYIRPIEDIQAQLDPHKGWLARYIKAGTILFAGPLEGGKAGFILAFAERIETIEAMIAEDPFDVLKLARFEISECNPVVRNEAFSAQWAPEAKAF